MVVNLNYMKIYNVGKDVLNEFDLNYIKDQSYVWFVYNYTEDHGDGGYGDGIALSKNKVMVYYNLAHCSCHGPLEERMCKIVTKEDLFSNKESIHDFSVDEKVLEKVKKLLKNKV